MKFGKLLFSRVLVFLTLFLLPLSGFSAVGSFDILVEAQVWAYEFLEDFTDEEIYSSLRVRKADLQNAVLSDVLIGSPGLSSSDGYFYSQGADVFVIPDSFRSIGNSSGKLRQKLVRPVGLRLLVEAVGALDGPTRGQVAVSGASARVEILMGKLREIEMAKRAHMVKRFFQFKLDSDSDLVKSAVKNGIFSIVGRVPGVELTLYDEEPLSVGSQVTVKIEIDEEEFSVGGFRAYEAQLDSNYFFIRFGYETDKILEYTSIFTRAMNALAGALEATIETKAVDVRKVVDGGSESVSAGWNQKLPKDEAKSEVSRSVSELRTALGQQAHRDFGYFAKVEEFEQTNLMHDAGHRNHRGTVTTGSYSTVVSWVVRIEASLTDAIALTVNHSKMPSDQNFAQPYEAVVDYFLYEPKFFDSSSYESIAVNLLNGRTADVGSESFRRSDLGKMACKQYALVNFIEKLDEHSGLFDQLERRGVEFEIGLPTCRRIETSATYNSSIGLDSNFFQVTLFALDISSSRTDVEYVPGVPIQLKKNALLEEDEDDVRLISKGL